MPSVPLWAGALITAVDSFIFLLLEQYGLRKLEAFFAALISVMCLAFGYMYVAHVPSQWEVFKGTVVPEMTVDAFEPAIGVVGAIIMPHNLYLHSALVLSRNIDFSNSKKVKEATFYYTIEASIALFVSFVINLFVVAVFALVFINPAASFLCTVTGTNVTSSNVDLLCSGEVLAQQFGSSVKYIWAIGLLAAGQSSTMTGTYAGQFVMEGFLKLKIAPWKRVTITRCFALVPTLCVAVLANNQILNAMNEYLNVLQSIQLPFAMLPLMHFTSIPGIMREFTNGKFLKFSCWLFTIIIIAINTYQVSPMI